ncbi:MAG: ribonuclease H-like domain-containing protein [Dehalococcoidia bacterium]|nr:ribonuclease H-like domain-containing protein [Dehalococcoidia bacterium]
MEAYLDIETTGLSPDYDEITVVGVYLAEESRPRLVQLVGGDITDAALAGVLNGVGTIYTYNGKRFDLPFIRARLGLDLEAEFGHCDLMYDCWRRNLYGGFKQVERQLGIPRRLAGIGGFEAVMLWYRYVNENDRTALGLLLEYNREDVMNLVVLRRKLAEF